MTQYETWDDVLADLMMEETEPTYEALLRWQERCRDYRETLADFFALWAIQREPIDDLPEIDEDAIAEKAVQYAMQLLEEQGRIIPDDHIEPVGDFDQMVLAGIYVLQGRGDASTLLGKVSEMAGRPVYLGGVLRSLSRLEEKHLIEHWESDPATESGGESVVYYSITIMGERALAYAKETSRVLAGLLGDFA
jgi:PadR family transcriptional regulator, regulatory protein PadR